MKGQSTSRPAPGSQGPKQRGPHLHRNPFVEKRAHHRREAQSRALARVRVPLSLELRQHKPLHRMPRWLKGMIGGLVLIISVGLHVAFLVTAFGVSRLGAKAVKPREQVAIEVREAQPKEEKKPEPPKAEPEPPKPERTVVRQVAPKAAEPEPPKDAPKAPPPRVVGLSFESTVGEGGGDGPAFAVGNTHQGETERIAAAPKKVVNKGPTTVKPTPNKIATNVPTAGVVSVPPKAKKSTTPVYPATLKAQGVEADVVVVVTIGVTGKVTKVMILKPSTYPEFNDAAKAAALQDEFEPATRDGVPYETTLKYTIRFRLNDE